MGKGIVVVQGEIDSQLLASHTRLDCGGIAVGYGLDRARGVLENHGVSAALLDAGGDLLAIGAPPGAAGWLVDIVDPRFAGTALATVRLRDQALATSANTVSVVRLGARLVGHVMDTNSGLPADRRLQASVLARTGIEADALSTAMLVTGGVPPRVLRRWTL